MHSLWLDQDRRSILERMDRVSPPRAPRWGTMNAEQMVQHVTAQLEMALGGIEVKLHRTWLRHWPVRAAIIYWLPWPHGAPTAPELVQFSTAHWDQARAQFKRTFDSVVARGPNGTFAPHPVFGPMSSAMWGVLMYRHLDHHLRQFGL